MPFTEEDTPYFFGREREIGVIGSNLRAAPLTLVYGPSGVGKTSVLRAGVLHQLLETVKHNQEVGEGIGECLPVYFSAWSEQRDTPLQGITAMIDEAGRKLLRPRALAASANSPSDRQFPQRLDTLPNRVEFWSEVADGPVLLILDQFEEFFNYNAPAEVSEFGKEMARLIENPKLLVHVLISLREDSLARLDRFKGQIPRLFENYIKVGHLTKEGGLSAILSPIERWNRQNPTKTPISIDDDLPAEVLGDVKTGNLAWGEAATSLVAIPDTDKVEAPFLQLVMTTLWTEDIPKGGTRLRTSTLQKLGGSSTIVKRHLVNVMSQFSHEEQQISAAVFNYLVTPSGGKIAQKTEDLAAWAKVPPAQLDSLVAKLSEGSVRILRSTGNQYEIYHDVLAGAILEWANRFSEEAERRKIWKQQQDELIRDLKAKRMRRQRLLLTLVVIVMAVLTAFAYVQSRAARRAQIKEEQKNNELMASQAVAQQRLQRIRDSLEAKQLAVAANVPELTIPPQFRPVTPIKFLASQRLSYHKPGGDVYFYKIWPDSSTLPTGLQGVALITYRMDHPSFHNSLFATGPDRQFTASYEGWGCLNQVLAIIEYVDPEKTPNMVKFNMCALLAD